MAAGGLQRTFRRRLPPAPPPAPPRRKRPPPSVWPPVDDPDETEAKKEKTGHAVSEREETVEEVSAAVKLQTKATTEHREDSRSNAAPGKEHAEETQATSSSLSSKRRISSGLLSKRPASSALEDEILQVAKRPYGSRTCWSEQPRALSFERGVQQEEKDIYKRLLQVGKQKPPPTSHCRTSTSKIEDGSQQPVVTGSHLEEHKHGDGVPLSVEVGNGAAVSNPQSSQGGDVISYHMLAENSWEQGSPEGQDSAGRQDGAGVSEGMFQMDEEPVLSRKSSALDAEERKFPSSKKTVEQFPPLTQAMEREIEAAFGEGKPDEVMSSAFKLRVTREDIRTLQGLCWLNDEVINFYMSLLMERSKKEAYPAVHAFTTFFYTKLLSGGYQAVKRWTKAVDLFKQDLILVPINLRKHWTLAVIDMRKKTVRHFDSRGQNGLEICATLHKYLQEESREKRNLDLVSSEWTVHTMGAKEIPQQENTSDCGVFMCQYANSISRDKPLTFTQKHMPYFRKKMVWEIIHQQLL